MCKNENNGRANRAHGERMNCHDERPRRGNMSNDCHAHGEHRPRHSGGHHKSNCEGVRPHPARPAHPCPPGHHGHHPHHPPRRPHAGVHGVLRILMQKGNLDEKQINAIHEIQLEYVKAKNIFEAENKNLNIEKHQATIQQDWDKAEAIIDTFTEKKNILLKLKLNTQKRMFQLLSDVQKETIRRFVTQY